VEAPVKAPTEVPVEAPHEAPIEKTHEVPKIFSSHRSAALATIG